MPFAKVATDPARYGSGATSINAGTGQTTINIRNMAAQNYLNSFNNTAVQTELYGLPSASVYPYIHNGYLAAICAFLIYAGETTCGSCTPP